MDGLTEGRIVHYILPDGNHTPAIITKVWNDKGLVNLQVITDCSNSLPYSSEDKNKFEDFGINLTEVIHGHIWQTSRLYSEEPVLGTWHWIEKA
jgi:hypothetical protein